MAEIPLSALVTTLRSFFSFNNITTYVISQYDRKSIILKRGFGKTAFNTNFEKFSMIILLTLSLFLIK